MKSSRTLKERLGLGKVRGRATNLARADPEPASPLLFPGTVSGSSSSSSSRAASRTGTPEASAQGPAETTQQPLVPPEPPAASAPAETQPPPQQPLAPPEPPAASLELEALRAERAALEEDNAGLQAALTQSRGAITALQSAVSALRSRADVADESKGATSRVLLDLTEKAGQLAAEKVSALPALPPPALALAPSPLSTTH